MKSYQVGDQVKIRHVADVWGVVVAVNMGQMQVHLKTGKRATFDAFYNEFELEHIKGKVVA